MKTIRFFFFLSEKFHFLEVTISICLNRCVFVMLTKVMFFFFFFFFYVPSFPYGG